MRIPKFLFILAFLGTLIFSGQSVISHFFLNVHAARTLRFQSFGVLSDSNLFPFSSSALSCHVQWFQGFQAQFRGDQSTRDVAWLAAIQCDPHYIRLLHIMLPEEEMFGSHSVQTQPDAPEGWFWLAELEYAVWKESGKRNLTEQERETAITNFKEGLQRDPKDGLRWLELGDLLQEDDLHAAIDAYLQSCFNGDPGYNGCWLAGRAAEQLGEIENAIQYYRYSRWEGALNRADELEAQLTPKK